MKNECISKMKTLWAQIDSNQHLRHSAYGDIAASGRLELFEMARFSMDLLTKENIGPILFHEETWYKKEIHGVQNIVAKSYLKRIERHFSKWSMVTEIYREDGELAAIVDVQGAWMDLKLRKIADLPEKFRAPFLELPKTIDFQLID